MTPEEILAGLSPAQRDAATTLAGPLLIKAGPGSGKTRTITHRIAYAAAVGAHDPRRTLALTFTIRAAGELRRRLRSLDTAGVTVRTFHSAALRQLRHFWPDAVGGPLARIEPDRASLLTAAAQRAGVADDPDTVAELGTELDWLKAHLRTAASYAEAGRDPAWLDAEAVARVLGEYEQVKTERQVMDFDDVLLVTVGLLDSRTDLRESVRRAFGWITVDEYQDVSPLQQRLLDLWVGERQQLCAVGDAAQAIYQFAGADPQLIRTFPARYRGASVVELEDTYRCAPVITEAANRLAARIDGAVRLRPAGSPEPGSLQVLPFPTEASEAAGIADEVAALITRGDRPSEIACLFRTNQQGRVLADEFRRRRIPFNTRGSDRFFDRGEINEAVIRFRGEVRAHPDRPVAEAVGAVHAAMGHSPEPPDSPQARDRWESVTALSAMLTADPERPAGDVLADLEDRVAEQDAPDVAGVSLLTLHGAKGSEWDTVFVVGASDAALPLLRARTPQGLAEERRLAYVGFTRARRRLVASWAARGSGGDRRAPSPYLDALQLGASAAPAGLPFAPELADNVIEHDHAGEGRPPARCRTCDRALVTGVERVLGRCDTCPSAADPEILAALHEWRDRTAAEAGLPGHAILTDTVLLALAEQRPGSAERLSRIPGFRPDKVARFGTQVLTVIHSAPVPVVGTTDVVPADR